MTKASATIAQYNLTHRHCDPYRPNVYVCSDGGSQHLQDHLKNAKTNASFADHVRIYKFLLPIQLFKVFVPNRIKVTLNAA